MCRGKARHVPFSEYKAPTLEAEQKKWNRNTTTDRSKDSTKGDKKTEVGEDLSHRAGSLEKLLKTCRKPRTTGSILLRDYQLGAGREFLSNLCSSGTPIGQVSTNMLIISE
ncbi:hypothetical protein T265_00041 [Opisthorchis viverrini]|uniref:Uncharacterized protein n=1 Tax=Opisthorchis viverrini TaxID=6198 RepID=A0A075AJY1_OPIVI|nr:hypothetical protein T265_00041 [Opisthorchis viverrini]KER34174.1 hypothetical protein T265_00041 [Opisthorchis viverrini]